MGASGLIFRPAAGCCVEKGNEEEGAKGRARKEQMTASWLLIAARFPPGSNQLVLLGNYPLCMSLLCLVCVCVWWGNRMSGEGWTSHSLNQQSVSYPLTLFQLARRNSFGWSVGRNHLNPLNNVCFFFCLSAACVLLDFSIFLPSHLTAQMGGWTDLIHSGGRRFSALIFNCLH